MLVRLVFIFSAKILNITRNDFDFCKLPISGNIVERWWNGHMVTDL